MSGYSYDFVDNPPDRLLCKICNLPCRDPWRTVCCGHAICESELELIKSIHRKEDGYPECRNKTFSTFVDKAAQREIKESKIYCPNKKDGCGWIGELSHVDDHLRGCEISCSKCKQIVYLSTMKSHLDTECPCYCPYCDMTAEREVISSEHKENCHKFPLTCPNNCGLDNIPRDNMDEHKKVCPLEMIQCEYQCGAVIARIEVDQHNKDNALQHVYSVKHELAISFQNVTELERKCIETEKALVTSTTSLSDVITTVAFKLKSNNISEKRSEFVSSNNLSTFYKCSFLLKRLNIFLTMSMLLCLLYLGCDYYVNVMAENHHPMISDFDLNTSLVVHDLIGNMPSLTSELMFGFHGPVYRLWELQLKCWSKTDLIAPVIIEMPDVDKHINNNLVWVSNPFYAFKGGYLMSLKVYAGGYNNVDNHLSVYLYLMKGQHDDELSWPMRGEYTINLLNPRYNYKTSHHGSTVLFDTNITTLVKDYKRVTKGKIHPTGIGIPEYILKKSILFLQLDYKDFLSQHNSLFFKIFYSHIL